VSNAELRKALLAFVERFEAREGWTKELLEDVGAKCSRSQSAMKQGYPLPVAARHRPQGVAAVVRDHGLLGKETRVAGCAGRRRGSLAQVSELARAAARARARCCGGVTLPEDRCSEAPRLGPKAFHIARRARARRVWLAAAVIYLVATELR